MSQVAAMCVLDLRGYNITGTYLTLKLQAIHASGANLGLAVSHGLYVTESVTLLHVSTVKSS